MTWASVFDFGQCTVKVSRVGADLFSGVLTKGQTSTDFSGFSGETLSVSIDGAGQITLSNSSGTVSTNSKYELRVVPAYDISTLGLQAAEITIANLGLFELCAFAAEPYDTQHVIIAGNGDTADMSGFSPKSEISVFMGLPT